MSHSILPRLAPNSPAVSLAGSPAGLNWIDECRVLEEMFDTQTTAKSSGEIVPLHSNLSVDSAGVLYQLILATRPAVAIEVGMAYGISSLAILAALRRTGGNGRLISIDPHQFTQWGGAGAAAVERAGLKDRHELIEDYDYLALPRLLGSGQGIGFAFIDGWHTFDYTLLDFWYLDKMLDVGGIVGFDDCEYLSVDKAIRFVQSHRRYEEVETGLTVAGEDYTGPRGRVKRMVGHKLLNRLRRWTGRKSVLQTCPNRYFRKAQDWEPDWDFYADF